jgi:hypothetical protein
MAELKIARIDSGPLGLLTHRNEALISAPICFQRVARTICPELGAHNRSIRREPGAEAEVVAASDWLSCCLLGGIRVVVPAIVYYELKR